MNLGAEAVDPIESLLGNVPDRTLAEFGPSVDDEFDAQHVANLGSERDAIAALELQDFARFVRARDGEAEPLDDLTRRAHLPRVAAG